MPEKQLACTARATAFQKAWFADLRRAVFDERRPYAIVQADVPFEPFQLLGIPAVSNQWWAALIAAKQMASGYLDAMEERGYHDGLCRYCSLGLACTLDGDRRPGPWGGLPRPAVICARLTCDCIQRVFDTWADALGAEFIPLDNPGATLLPPRWWELSRTRWRELVEPDRLAFAVADLRALVGALERISDRTFDLDALRSLMHAVNTQEEIFDEVRTLVCEAQKCPVRMTEQIANVMATQWVRGSDWAIAHARAFRDEVKARVESGTAACPDERVRLMWVGAGLWHDTDFYTAFEPSHGAVFVWSMYLAFGPDGYIRYGLDDPLAALASRSLHLNEQLHNPPWANEWIVDQARRHRIDGAVILAPGGMRPAATGKRFVARALERAGIPALIVDGDQVDARKWDRDHMRRVVGRFIDDRLRVKGAV
jgi:hypothetical protein